MKPTKIITKLTVKQLLRDLLNNNLPANYRNACRNEYFNRAEL